MSNDKDRDEALEAQIEADWGYLIEHVGKGESDEALSSGMMADFSSEEISLIRFIERDRARVCAEVTQQERERLFRKMPTKQELIAVMQSRGCDGIVSVKLAASDIWKRLATILTTKSPSEPRACETCKNEWDALTKKEMCDTIQRIRELTGNDGTESPERTVERLVENLSADTRRGAAEDVEIVESTIKAFKAWVQAKVKYTPYIEGSAYQALAALDRISGKEA
jgi:hypothetical protein